MRISRMMSRVVLAAAVAGLAGWSAALAQGRDGAEPALDRDLTVAQKPLYQLAPDNGAIDVEAWVDRPSLTYVIGQPMRVMVRPRQDAHITVVNVDSAGQVALLYPNHFQRDTRVSAGATVMVPHDGASWRFTITGPAGIDLIKVFASPRPLSLPELDQLVRASEKSPLVALGRSADDVARDLVAQIKPDAAGSDQPPTGMRNLLIRIVAEAPAPVAATPALSVRTDRPVYRVGEKVQVSVTAHRDCRLTVVGVGTSGTAAQLFPNPAAPSDIVIQPGQTVEIPDPLTPLEIVARAPAGVQSVFAVCRDAAEARPQAPAQGDGRSLGTPPAFGRDLIAGAAGHDPAKQEISATAYLVVE